MIIILIKISINMKKIINRYKYNNGKYTDI